MNQELFVQTVIIEAFRRGDDPKEVAVTAVDALNEALKGNE